MSYKNSILRFLVQRCAKRPEAVKDPRRILAVSTTALGDTLWAMPALAALRKSFPSAHLAFLTSSIGTEIAKHNPWTDAVHRWERPLDLRRRLRGQFDTAIVLHASQRLVIPFCASLGVSQLVGTAGINKGLDDLLTEALPQKTQHEVDRRLDLVECIGGAPYRSPLSFFLQPEEKIQLEGRWVAIHPGAADSYKCWPIEHFAAVGRELKRKFGCEILVTGSKAECSLMQRLAEQIPGALMGDPNLSLRRFAATLDAVDLLICSDTGPFHLACALQTPAIGIYSPTDPEVCGPYLCKTAVICTKKKSCMPCLRRKCREPFCLRQIGIEEVLAKASTLLCC